MVRAIIRWFKTDNKSSIQGWKKYFDSGILTYFPIESVMSFIPNENPSKMEFVYAK